MIPSVNQSPPNKLQGRRPRGAIDSGINPRHPHVEIAGGVAISLWEMARCTHGRFIPTGARTALAGILREKLRRRNSTRSNLP
jgi:hypothetical protein